MKKIIVPVVIMCTLLLHSASFAITLELTLESYEPATLPTVSKFIDIPDINDQLEISRQAVLFASSPEGWNLMNLGDSAGPNTLSPAVGWSGTAHQYLVYGDYTYLDELFGYELNLEAITYGLSDRILTFHTDELVYRLSHDIGESSNNFGLITGGLGGIWSQAPVPNWGRFSVKVVPEPAYMMPDTGQSQSYTDTFGEDSDYLINPPSYTKLDATGNPLPDDAVAWSMVRDDNTGLIWESKTTDCSIHDKNALYDWYDAQTDFIGTLNATKYGGFSDWRLPKPKELVSISDYGKYPPVNIDYFPNTNTDKIEIGDRWAQYWSSTPASFSSSRAWTYWLPGGQCHYNFRERLFYVRAVRGEECVHTFLDNHDGTITDVTTGLMWEQKTNESGIHDKDNTYTWEGALGWIASLNASHYLGYSDWRLPHIKELQSIVSFTRHEPSIDTRFFPNTISDIYWSSTTVTDSPQYAWAVWFDHGYVDLNCHSFGGKTDYAHVRAVRSVAPVPGVLLVTSSDNFTASGYEGGPFSPSTKSYTLENKGGCPIDWTVSHDQLWISLSSSSGTLQAGSNTTLAVSINSNVDSLTAGNYYGTITFTNTTNGSGTTTRSVHLMVNSLDCDADGMPDSWEEQYGLDTSIDDSRQDLDKDGLSNFDEYQYGTNPTVSDTDNDDLPDGWEVAYGLNPLASTGDNGRDGDSDNDSWTNYQEYVSDTDPNKPSSTPTNNPPTAACLAHPLDTAEITSPKPTLSVINATDLDEQALTYTFAVYADQELTSLVTSISGVNEGQSTTAWQVETSLNDNTLYYWRARAYDGISYGEWMDTARFFVNTANDPPTIPILSSPPDDAEVTSLHPVLEIDNATDIDGDLLTYEIEVYAYEHMSTLETSKTGIPEGDAGTTSWQVDIALEDNTLYWWRAQARDNEDMLSGWSDLFSFFVNTANDAPTPPSLSSPPDGEEINTIVPVLEVTNSTDSDMDILTYFFEIDTFNTFDSPSFEQSNAVEEGPGTTSTWSPPELDDNTTHYWRVRAYDGAAYSQWVTGSFFVNVENDRPMAPTLNNPVSGGTLICLTPTLSVNNAIDLDGDALSYNFELYADQNLSSKVGSVTLPQGDHTTCWTTSTELGANKIYYWRSQANDGELLSSWMPTAVFTVNPLGANTVVDIEVSENVSCLAEYSQIIKVLDDSSPIKGVSVEIPPGALPNNCTITIGEVKHAPALPKNTEAIGSVLAFGPSGIAFSAPVTITIPYTQADLNNVGLTDPAELEVFTYDTSTLLWEKIPVHSVNTAKRVLVCTVDHFSMYTAGKTVEPSQSGGGGCFIATAAYGSHIEPHVTILRDFRDRHLLNNPAGLKLVNLYNQYSPPMATFIEKNPTLRAVVRIGLLPLVAFSYLSLHCGFAITVGIAIVFLSLAIILPTFFLRKALESRRRDRM